MNQVNETQKMFTKMFNTWEQQASQSMEQYLRNPSVLNFVGNFLQSGLKYKIYWDQFCLHSLKNLMLPNKRDQEKMMHQLNELNSRINDVEDNIEEGNIEIKEALEEDFNKTGRHHIDLNKKLKKIEDQIKLLTNEIKAQKNEKKVKQEVLPVKINENKITKLPLKAEKKSVVKSNVQQVKKK